MKNFIIDVLEVIKWLSLILIVTTLALITIVSPFVITIEFFKWIL